MVRLGGPRKLKKKHFVQNLGAKPQYEVDWEDYEEGSRENDSIMDLLHFGDNENWLGSLVVGNWMIFTLDWVKIRKLWM